MYTHNVVILCTTSYVQVWLNHTPSHQHTNTPTTVTDMTDMTDKSDTCDTSDTSVMTTTSDTCDTCDTSSLPSEQCAVVINASELAAAINMSNYTTPDQVIAKMLKRRDPKLYYANLAAIDAELMTAAQLVKQARLDVSTAQSAQDNHQADQQVDKVLENKLVDMDQEKISVLLDQLVSCEPQQRLAVLESSLACQYALKPKIAEKRKLAMIEAAGSPDLAKLTSLVEMVKVKHSDQLSSAVKSVVNCARGNIGETPAIRMYEQQTGRTVHSCNAKLYSKVMVETPGMRLVLNGKVDGLANNRVVEVKTRRFKFFDKLPDYESVQIQAYMFLTDNKLCDLVQAFDNQIKISSHKFIPTKFEKIVQAAKQFGEQFVKIVASHDCQRAVLAKLAQCNQLV
jgi:hypothetical protein